jgi:VWFA-related protein
MSLCLLSSSARQSSSGDWGTANLLLTAIDKNKQAVSMLHKEDLRVLEDGVQQVITDFKQQTNQPLSALIMLDMSISQERVIPIAKQVSREFVDAVIREGKDRVGVITFTGEAKLEQELTGSLQQVHQAIERIEFKPPIGYMGKGQIILQSPKQGTDQEIQASTAIWDAIEFASKKFGAETSASPRSVVILITDGWDSSSKRKLNEAVEVAIKSGVVVYSIGIGDEYYGKPNGSELRKISERTGGRAYFPEKVKDLRAAFVEIEQELHSQYSISFTSVGNKADGKMRKIKIEVVNPELRKRGVEISYPQVYFGK